LKSLPENVGDLGKILVRFAGKTLAVTGFHRFGSFVKLGVLTMFGGRKLASL
jgi:hypothetical protein